MVNLNHTLNILFEDNHLLVLNKPADLVTMGAAESDPSLVKLAKAYIAQKYNKMGNVYLGVVSRLDRMSSGVVVLARTSKAASRLTAQFRDRTVDKVYWALIAGKMDQRIGYLEDFVRKDDSQHRMVTCTAKAKGAKSAKLRYEVQGSGNDCQHLKIQLETGRKHQIRLQLSSRGLPIIGDRKYGSSKPFSNGIALHSRVLRLEHPTLRQRMEFTADAPKCWKKYLRR